MPVPADLTDIVLVTDEDYRLPDHLELEPLAADTWKAPVTRRPTLAQPAAAASPRWHMVLVVVACVAAGLMAWGAR